MVEDRVRDGVRAQGIDPLAEPDMVRGLVDSAVADVVSDWPADDPSLVDVDALARHAFQAVAGFGALQPFFDDPTVEELWINEPGRVFVARDGESEKQVQAQAKRKGVDIVHRSCARYGHATSRIQHYDRRTEVNTLDTIIETKPAKRLHVNLNEPTAAALQAVGQRLGLNATESIRQAVGVWKFLMDANMRGATIRVVEPDGTSRDLLIPAL